jgi:hypothetical protein
VPVALVDERGNLSEGLSIFGKTELVDVMSRWLEESSASTIGDVGSFGGRPWLRIDVSGVEVVLNADTKRAAVETFVREGREDPERPWRVVANRNGRINKILPWPQPDLLPGWYAYLPQPATEEGFI